MGERLFIDLETRSVVDLKQYGLWRYSQDPSTDIYCLGFMFDSDEEPGIIYFRDGVISGEGDQASRVAKHVLNGGRVLAHNATFEWVLWNEVLAPRYEFPKLPLEQMECTMARCYAMGLPGSLDDAGHALGLDVEKDATGHQLMLRLCKPSNMKRLAEGKDPKPKWLVDQDAFTFLGEKVTGEWALKRLGEYCMMDVEVERQIAERTYALSEYEQKVWRMDQRINRHGVQFDMEAVNAALRIRDRTAERLNEQLTEVTGGAVQATTAIQALKEWMADYGVFADSLAKFKLQELLEVENLPDEVRTALELRQEAGRATSVAKLDAAHRHAGEDGRVRFLYQYHGAHTGRWAGRNIQTHNLTRDLPDPEEVEEIMGMVKNEQIELLDAMYGSPLSIISRVLRGFIVAGPGLKLVGGDWSNVEGRALAWLAGEDWKLQAFRKADAGLAPDIYIQSYSRAFGVPTEEVPAKGEERQLGKVMELSLGYQGGVGAFKNMAETYGVDIPDDGKIDRIKESWRGIHPKVKSYWYALERAAIRAVQNIGTITTAGPRDRQVKFRVAGSFLWCLLPSGRALCYPYPQIQSDDYGLKLTYKTVPSPDDHKMGRIIKDKGNVRNWARMSTYGGKLAENITQAICRDVLADAMLRIEEQYWFGSVDEHPIVMHVHDEAVVEGNFSERDREAVQAIMVENPAWAQDMPLVADVWRAERYRKE